VFFCGSVSFIFLAFCVVLLCVFMCCGIISRFESQCVLYIQYWCIDGKYIIYVARLRNGEMRAFSESFHPFRAEPHKFYIYRQYTNLYLFCNNIWKKMLFNLIITETPLIPQ
jgi:hypothetical protein